MGRLSKKTLLDESAFRALIGPTATPLDQFRSALTKGRDQLLAHHKKGSEAKTILTGNSWLVDRLVINAWHHLKAENMTPARSVLLAVGGYGRCELHPQSDIDLLIVFQTEPDEAETLFSEKYVRFLWDIGLHVGHSVRTLKGCIEQASDNITVVTNMMESRFLTGNQQIMTDLTSLLDPELIWDVENFFQAKWDEQISRHHRYNDTAFNLEPHIKEGPGGLRDIHTIAWIAQRHFGGRDFRTLIEHGFLTVDEYRTLERGRKFLWKIRNCLHFISGRREDRLLFDYQTQIASDFGYTDSRDSLAVEKLMKRYYRTVKGLRFLNELLLQYFHEEILSPDRKNIVNLNRRFRSVDGMIETRHSNIFEEQPFALLEIFVLLQQRPELHGIQANTIRQIWSSRRLVDASFRKDIRCRSLFMEMLRSAPGQIHSLRRMNDYGILGSYIPVFGRVIGQMQHDLFHFFTVDAHLLFVVRNLRRLELEDYEDELPFLSNLMSTIFKRHRLILAALFHDIAKGRGGDHSKLGEKEAYAFCRLHDLSDYDSKFVSWLVRHHLLMSWVAQRKDISDPVVVNEFARIIGNQERLDNLYLLTVSDIRGTSPYVWNDWKGKLLMDLYIATSRALQRGVDAPVDLSEQVSDIRKETLTLLANNEAIIESTKNFWDTLEPEYFLRYQPETIAWHAENLLATPITDLPLIAVRPQNDSATIQFLICASDSDHLFANITATFDQENMNIIEARVHKTTAGLAMMIFIVPITTNNSSNPTEIHASATRMKKRLLTPETGDYQSLKRQPAKMKHFPIKTEVVFHQDRVLKHTVMEVIAQDRPGLLHQVAMALVHCKAHLVTARISTFGERAEDIFHLNSQDGGAIKFTKQKECLANKIQKSLA